MSINFETKISQLSGVNKQLINKLKKLEIETIKDLIFYYPYRFDDYSKVFKIKDLPDFGLAMTVGRLELIGNKRTSRRKMIITEAILTDDTGSVKIIWFNQPWISKSLKVGDKLKIWGKISSEGFNLFFNSPDYQIVFNDNEIKPIGISPVYQLTAGLQLKQLKNLVIKVLKDLDLPIDFLPEKLIKKNNLLSWKQAIKQIHFPESFEMLSQAQKRLAFDELFLIKYWSLLVRENLIQTKSSQIIFNEEKIKQLVAELPFSLTLDQKKAVWQIIQDLAKKFPMNRLLEGDVGSGKTIVALIAMFNVLINNKQAVLMVPTEILANQHYQVFQNLLSDYNFKIILFTRNNCFLNGEKIHKKELIKLLKDEGSLMVIGTHALIQEEIKFSDLALAVIDEQHRFGVKQRQQLKLNNLSGLTPHFLSMTATPIPRSLALAIFGDLDISIIKTLPSGRLPIISRVVEEKNRNNAYQFISNQVKNGRQVFVICPLIDVSDKFGFKSVIEEQKKLDQEIFKDFRVGLLHGKLKKEDKEKVMSAFQSGEIDVLVATSVVEVGIDIKNASVMMIEGAERFGLAQLHQFRGRVGRSIHQSYCFLFTDSSDNKTIERLKFLADCSDGFKLAEYDLKNRGSGNFFGEDQSGFLDSLKFANLNDLVMVNLASQSAKEFVDNFKIADYPLLQERINELGLISHLE